MGDTELTAAECRTLAEHAAELPLDRREALAHAQDFTERVELTLRHIAERISDPLPVDLDDLLWDFGWAIYEQSWEISNRVRAQFSSAEEEGLADCARRLANVAERMPRPDRGPRAGGALRVHALILSKRDTTIGYDLANAQHEGADDWLHGVRGTNARDSRLSLACDELEVQFETAKAGTACRRVETFLCDPGRLDADVVPREVLRATATSTRAAITAGIGSLLKLRTLPPLATRDSRRERLLIPRWWRQPANMAARAHLLLAAAIAALDDMGEPWAPHSARLWSLHSEFVGREHDIPTDYRSELALHREAVAPYIEVAERAAVAAANGSAIAARDVAETARIRLHLHLQFPDVAAPAIPDVVPYSGIARGDGPREAAARFPHASSVPIEGLSAWLSMNGQDANVVGTARHPQWIEGFERLRQERTGPGELWPYGVWRADYPHLARQRTT